MISHKMGLFKDCWQFLEKRIVVEPIAFFAAFSIGLSQVTTLNLYFNKLCLYGSTFIGKVSLQLHILQ